VEYINWFLIKLNLMNTQHKSTPKMRRSYTPRLKSAQVDRNNDPKKALYFTNNKNSDKNIIK